MGKRQYRKSFSLRPRYVLLAGRIGKAWDLSASAAIENSLRDAAAAYGVDLPTDADVDEYRRQVDARRYGGPPD